MQKIIWQQPNIYLFCLENEESILTLSNYGAMINRFQLKKNDQKLDMILSFQNLQDYKQNPFYIGSTIGRFSNRIKNGEFILNQKKYQLEKNNNQNHLHGGLEGFDKKIFDYQIISDSQICFSYTSKDQDQGYPGQLQLKVIYTLVKSEIQIEYIATTDTQTIINMTNHSYFNLNQGKENILQHQLKIISDQYLESEQQIPTGKFLHVQNSIFDFSDFQQIGKNINDEQLKNQRGYDNSFKLNNNQKLELAAIVECEQIRLKVYTNQPSIHLYTGNYLNDNMKANNGNLYSKQFAFCLECQNYPDAINIEEFKNSCILDKNQTYKHITNYNFEFI